MRTFAQICGTIFEVDEIGVDLPRGNAAESKPGRELRTKVGAYSTIALLRVSIVENLMS